MMTKLFQLILLFTLSLLCYSTYGQNITHYKDLNDQLYAISDGIKIKLYHQETQNIWQGYHHLIYETHDHEFWLYDGNKQQKIGNSINHLTVTDHLLPFLAGKKLFVFEDGFSKPLSSSCAAYYANDSLIVFFDDFSNQLSIYYNNEVIDVERLFDVNRFTSKKISVGENTATFMTEAGETMLFYRGKFVRLLPANTGGRIASGRDITAYEDWNQSSFYAYENGKSILLEDRLPKNFRCGDNRVVYVNEAEEFILYHQGEKKMISSFPPDFYEIVDNMIIYGENDFFYVYYNGQVYELENYIPSSYQIDRDRLVYLNQNDRIEQFHKGERSTLTSRKTTDYLLNGNSLRFSFTDGSSEIIQNGKVYEAH